MELTRKTFNNIKKPFIELVGEETFKKECSFALQHLAKNVQLQKANPDSLLTSVLNIAQVGLTLNPIMKLAYLVPRYDRSKGVICCLEPSYQGLVKLLTDTGAINNVYAHVVRKGDEFQQILGTENTIIHKPKIGNREDIEVVYAVAVLANGSKQTEVMDVEEIDGIRGTSESYKAFKSGKIKSCIWDKWYEEMARKTVIKRLTKYLPKSNHEKLMKAVDLADEDYKSNYEQLSYIDSLLLTSTITEERKEHIEKFMNTYSHSEAEEVIKMLKINQADSVMNGGGGSQTQIGESLDKLK